MRVHAALLPVAAGLIMASPAERMYEVRGRTIPPTRASITLHGATTPFSSSTLTVGDGRFRFKRILTGQYTVSAFAPGYGEKRLTISVGPSTADAKGRMDVDVRLEEHSNIAAGQQVSAAELAVPPAARKQYDEAQKRLATRDIQKAIEHLDRAVEIAPKFAGAWNNLGTIAYQTRDYPAAERHFRRALEADRSAYEPLVNLGGVLLTLNRPDDAFQLNLYAVLARPTDALANSQLGMNYWMLQKSDLAEKYLLEARRIDPAHFSHPQLLLAEIYLRRGDGKKAALFLDEFLRYHPDEPNAEKIRAGIEKLLGI